MKPPGPCGNGPGGGDGVPGHYTIDAVPADV